jgi:acyl CoA:acetate/3-ketoacid CoA transferase beta subunit
MVLREIAAGRTVDDVVTATDVPLLINENDLGVF